MHKQYTMQSTSHWLGWGYTQLCSVSTSSVFFLTLEGRPHLLCVANYASVRMRRRHTVVGLCVSHSVILSFCHSVCL